MRPKFIYPDVIDEIRLTCSNHLLGISSSDDVQRSIQRGEEIIVAIEERDIRNFLLDLEGQLELAKFTLDDEKKDFETKRIANLVLSWLYKRESSD